MFHEVTVRPSGNRFEVREGESILDAGLRAGLNLRYSCSNGTCGECRATCLQGELRLIRHQDFSFGAAERARGAFLMCSNTAIRALEIEAREIGSAAEIAPQRLTAKVSKLERIDAEHLLVHLRTPRSSVLQFLAGQQIDVRLGGLAARRLALANCPCDGLRPQLHVRRIGADAFSEQLFDQVRVGSQCVLEGPSGDFVLDETERRPLLFVAYETGFAPVNSLLEHVIALEWEAPLRLIWLADTDGGIYLRNYCRSLVDALDDFEFDAGALGGGPQGFVAALRERLRACPDLGSYAVFAVPPPGQGEAVRAALADAGVQAQRLKLAELEWL